MSAQFWGRWSMEPARRATLFIPPPPRTLTVQKPPGLLPTHPCFLREYLQLIDALGGVTLDLLPRVATEDFEALLDPREYAHRSALLVPVPTAAHKYYGRDANVDPFRRAQGPGAGTPLAVQVAEARIRWYSIPLATAPIQTF